MMEGIRGGGNLIRYANRYLSIVRGHVRSGSLIDVGSFLVAHSQMLLLMQEFSVTVMDYVKPENLASNIQFIEGNLNDVEMLEDNSAKYDVVTSWAVLEHVLDPKLACSNLANLCKPGGMIFLSTPEIGTRLTNNLIGGSDWFHPPAHLHLLSPMAIKNLFLNNNCEVIEWGRMELNLTRYLGRYGIGLLGALKGAIIKFFFL